MRFEVKRVNDINGKGVERRYHLSDIEYLAPTGFGVFDNKKGLFVGNTDRVEPWNWKSKKIAQEVVDAFNTVGPTGKLEYAYHKKGMLRENRKPGDKRRHKTYSKSGSRRMPP